MSDESEQVVNGDPWTNERYLSSYEEATFLRDSLKARDHSGTLQVKIKRCGVGGTLYVVKSRQSKELRAATAAVEEELNAPKPAKKSKKAKN